MCWWGQCQQAAQFFVVNSHFFQAFKCLSGVIQGGAETALRFRKNLPVGGRFKMAGEVRAFTGEREGQCFDGAFWRFTGKPFGVVDAGGHFTLPQQLQGLRSTGFGHSVDDTFATAAGQQGKYQARAFGCAAVDSAPHFQCAMVATQVGRAVFFELEFRPPDQGGISKNPNIRNPAPLRFDLPEHCLRIALDNRARRGHVEAKWKSGWHGIQLYSLAAHLSRKIGNPAVTLEAWSGVVTGYHSKSN